MLPETYTLQCLDLIQRHKRISSNNQPTEILMYGNDARRKVSLYEVGQDLIEIYECFENK